MRRSSLYLFLLSAIALNASACECSKKEAAPAAPTHAANAEAPSVEAPPQPEVVAVAMLEDPRAAEANRLFEERKWAEAFVAYQDVLGTAGPRPAGDASWEERRFQCKAAFAAFRAEQSSVAWQWSDAIRESLLSEEVPEEQKVGIASCLYNLGLIEREHDQAKARAYLERSLVLRESAAVARVLNALNSPVEEVSNGCTEVALNLLPDAEKCLSSESFLAASSYTDVVVAKRDGSLKREIDGPDIVGYGGENAEVLSLEEHGDFVVLSHSCSFHTEPGGEDFTATTTLIFDRELHQLYRYEDNRFLRPRPFPLPRIVGRDRIRVGQQTLRLVDGALVPVE